MQSLRPSASRTTRSAESGSWLGQAWQGKGIGTLNRIAILTLAFDGLGADEVTTSAWADNLASNAVTRKLGYEPNGEERLDREGRVTVQKRFRMSRQMWDSRGAGPAPPHRSSRASRSSGSGSRSPEPPEHDSRTQQDSADREAPVLLRLLDPAAVLRAGRAVPSPGDDRVDDLRSRRARRRAGSACPRRGSRSTR